MDSVNAAKEKYSQNPNFKQLAFIVGVLLVLGAWKFGLEGIME